MLQAVRILDVPKELFEKDESEKYDAFWIETLQERAIVFLKYVQVLPDKATATGKSTPLAVDRFHMVVMNVSTRGQL